MNVFRDELYQLDAVRSLSLGDNILLGRILGKIVVATMSDRVASVSEAVETSAQRLLVHAGIYRHVMEYIIEADELHVFGYGFGALKRSPFKICPKGSGNPIEQVVLSGCLEKVIILDKPLDVVSKRSGQRSGLVSYDRA